MRRALGIFAVAALLAGVAGCGGGEDITAAQVEAMSEQEALGLLQCQLQLASEEMGQKEAVDYSVDLMEEGMDSGDSTPIQVALWNEDGYRCPEYLP